MDKYNVIVVGAGNAGMAAAAACAKCGLKTLLLERHNIIGGSAQSFRRGRFEFEASLHELGGVGSKETPGPVLQALSALGVDIDWRIDPHLFRVIVDGEDGYDVTMPAGLEHFCDKMEEMFPGCRQSVHNVFDLVDAANRATAYLSAGKIDPQVLATEHVDFMRLVSHSAKECMDALGIPEKAQSILSTYWPYLGSLPDREDAFHFFYMLWLYVVFYPQMPAKRSPELAYSFTKSITDNGGEIWTNSEVKELLITDGTVHGVKLADGREIEADRVICNGFPNAVMQSLPKEMIPERSLKLANAREIGLSFVTIYIGLNKSAEELGIKDYSVFWYPTTDYHVVLERSYDYGGKGWIIANCHNILVPGATPEGTCEMFFTSAVHGDIWKNVKPEEYNKKKLEIAENILRTYEKKLGIEIMPYIEEIEVATPVTFARYLHTPNGTPYGYQTKPWDSIMARTMNVKNEGMFKNLRFCGAHSERGDGYSANIGGGFLIGMQVAKGLKEDK